MVDLGLYDGVIVAFERDLWPVRFEQVLIHTEAWAERLQGGFKSLHRIFLTAGIEALVVHAWDAENSYEKNDLSDTLFDAMNQLRHAVTVVHEVKP